MLRRSGGQFEVASAARHLGITRPTVESHLRALEMTHAVYDLFVEICPVVLPVTLADADQAGRMLGGTAGPGVRDAIHTAVMLNDGVGCIATFDEVFDQVDRIARVPLD